MDTLQVKGRTMATVLAAPLSPTTTRGVQRYPDISCTALQAVFYATATPREAWHDHQHLEQASAVRAMTLSAGSLDPRGRRSSIWRACVRAASCVIAHVRCCWAARRHRWCRTALRGLVAVVFASCCRRGLRFEEANVATGLTWPTRAGRWRLTTADGPVLSTIAMAVSVKW
jgi:hypothetical protein